MNGKAKANLSGFSFFVYSFSLWRCNGKQTKICENDFCQARRRTKVGFRPARTTTRMAGIRPQRLSALSLHLHSSKKKRKNGPAEGSEMKKQSCGRWEAIAEKQMTNPRMASTLHRRAANRRPYGLGFDIRAFLWPSERKS